MVGWIRGAGGIALVTALLFLALWVFVPGFASGMNLTNLALSVATTGMVACTMLLCLVAGDFDLSVGSTLALAGVLAALLLKEKQPVAVAVIVPMLVGALIGAGNGFLIARANINALIATLGTMQIVRGAARIACGGSSVGVSNESFLALGKTSMAGVQSPVWFMVAFFIVFGWVLNRTVFGRDALAIGGNLQAARLAGISVAKTKIAIFALQGSMAAFAGVVLASRVSSGQPNTGEGLELQVISGCVLGGVSLTGGVGTLRGIVFGVFLMGMVKNAMELLNVPTFWQAVASGAILLIAVLLDRKKGKAVA